MSEKKSAGTTPCKHECGFDGVHQICQCVECGHEWPNKESEGTTPQAERPDSPYNAVSEMLGKYLNTMVADLGLENKGQYLRDLFSQYEKEVSLAEVQWRARAVAPVETPD